jgi:predicted kinase
MSLINMANDLPRITNSTEEGKPLEPAEILEAFRETLFQMTEACITAEVTAVWTSAFGRMPTQAEIMAVLSLSARTTINHLGVPVDQLRRNHTASRLIKMAEEAEARFDALQEAGKPWVGGPSLESPLSQERDETDAEIPHPSEESRKAARVSRSQSSRKRA